MNMCACMIELQALRSRGGLIMAPIVGISERESERNFYLKSIIAAIQINDYTL